MINEVCNIACKYTFRATTSFVNYSNPRLPSLPGEFIIKKMIKIKTVVPLLGRDTFTFVA